MSLLLGARIFIGIVYFNLCMFLLFFLFNQEESLRKFVFDYKVHGIILCAMLSIAAGRNYQPFYDKEKKMKLPNHLEIRLQSF